MHQVGAVEAAPRAGVAERGEPGDDELRVLLGEGGEREPEGIPVGQRGAVEQDVRLGEQVAELGGGVRGVPVEGDGALAAVVIPEVQRGVRVGLIAEEGAQAAGGAALGRLDLDHLGTQAGEDQAAVVDGLVTHLEYPDPGQRALDVRGFVPGHHGSSFRLVVGWMAWWAQASIGAAPSRTTPSAEWVKVICTGESRSSTWASASVRRVVSIGPSSIRTIAT